MKILLVGPYPPPFGGISVHVRNVREILSRSGVECAVLNVAPSAVASHAYVRISGAADLLKKLFQHVLQDWKLHVHTNGHNPRSWFVALVCGSACQFGPGGVLTLHSGLLPEYLRSASSQQRAIARLACLLYDRVVCVNAEIAETLRQLGIPASQLAVMPAFLPSAAPAAAIPTVFSQWIVHRQPVLSTALSFRPEYGFEVLVSAIERLRRRFPQVGCIVMGGGSGRAAGEALVRQRGIGSHVLFAGEVHHDLCLRLMTSSDLFVRPTFGDGDANSVREALGLGVPVVASNVGNRPNGVTLFRPGDDQELANAIERTLGVERAETVAGSEPGSDSFARLMALYTSGTTS